MINRKTRVAVFAKFDGHCAYCGCKLRYEDMQVDHYTPRTLNGTDDIDNLMPSCRMCNFYKGGYSAEEFRKSIANTLDYKHTFATRLALRYGILTEHKWNEQFYHERKNNETN